MSVPGNIHHELALGPTLDGTTAAPSDEQKAVSVQDPLAVMPARIGRYVVLRRLGEGGMGVVFSAYDPDLDRKVAIKLVRDSHRQGSVGRVRMMREAQAMAQVSHSNVVHVYEVGESDDLLFIAMEFVPGMSLQEWQAQQAEQHPTQNHASIQAVLGVYLQAAAGLYAAHQLGIVHRVKGPPKNCREIGDLRRARNAQEIAGQRKARGSDARRPWAISLGARSPCPACVKADSGQVIFPSGPTRRASRLCL